jgi:hypothetical protein
MEDLEILGKQIVDVIWYEPGCPLLHDKWGHALQPTGQMVVIVKDRFTGKTEAA